MRPPRTARWGTLVLLVVLVAACGGSGTPEALVAGRTVFGDSCSTCHGSAGEGGVGPALTGVAATFPACADHIEWVTLGSDGWRAAHGDTYGATARPVVGGMPAHRDVLTADEIAAVVAFERVTYGGVAADAALADCGIAAGE